MLWVLAFFFFSYGMLHAYFFLKVQFAFRLPRTALLTLAAFLMLMIFSIILIRFLERNDHVLGARLLGMVGYPWIALIFWFCVFGLTLDAWNLLMRASARIVPWMTKLSLAARPAIYVVAAGVAITAALSLVEANRVRVREISIQTPLLPPGTPPIRLAQISDLHLGIHRGPRLLRQVIDKLNEIKPDVIVSTGDMVDSDFPHIEDLAQELAELSPPLGKYAVLGNHEYYWKETASLAFHQLAGFTVLRQDATHISPSVVLAGVDDRAGRYTRQNCFDDEGKTFDAAARDAFIILLKHQPLVLEESIGRFDLQLSGHVHDGQVFPFQLVVRFLYPYLCGTYRLGPRSLLNVSRGIGTWGPPMRLGARPEICVITLEPAGGR
jgi:predicted MPP superfamily phosphohydrolase